MGVLNATPNSFSDGGLYDSLDAALSHAHEMLAAGADIIDVGGQSTRPGAEDVTPEQEWQRIGQVVTQLAAEGVTVSVDPIHAQTARRAAEAGAAIINDVSGSLADPDMSAVIADLPVAYICQHWRGNPQIMDTLTDYPAGVVTGVLDELAERLDTLVDAGVGTDRIILDPGLGFAKTHDQSWQLLAGIDRFVATGFPILIGASRKRFLALAGGEDVLSRDPATAAVTALSAAHGAWGVRVHDCAPSAAAVRVASLWKEH